ncbi:Cytochrome c oxidase subunit III [Thalassovita autumnalis]|uniref:Cbb3-type cytochrome c oxidase subunit n=1 Tax=Thalassovita autumnalis TaxID=2072972 RepID=A0A0P1F8J4_9RHOB|nr:cytochrome-c oxidase, cbb3-type subunit III [Thalassovita autumnalis]CUH64325.1 Cytochrome c oxidase subunit III [Thalassovita autumnalis]CUH74401.1 Cytochrome c oxidase subunit III [Thalassovita autumnalis]
MAKKPTQNKDVGTTGHSWDGIEELNTPLPRWWLWTFYATIVWGLYYVAAYPAWPLINGATQGFLGFSTRAEVAADIAEFEAKQAPMNDKLASVELTAIADDAELLGYANSAGAAVFKTWCAQCHGSGASGAVGYPNLVDDDWLWGGDIESIHTTITVGVRQPTDEDYLRQSEMPAFGRDELLEDGQIDEVVNFVMSLSGDAQDATLVEAGAVVYEENCAACHGDEGKGDIDQGAPNLADAIWLYGDSYDAIRESVYYARYGAMPAWNTRLSEAEIRAVSTFVHTRGGGQ